MGFDVNTFDVAAFDRILARGLCSGVGDRDGQMCIEAAICAALGMPHGDNPKCVEPAVRYFKITLNDNGWSSMEARAKGLRSLGLAQLGSNGVVNGVEFAMLLAERTIRIIIPDLFRRLFPDDENLLAAALRCELEGTREAAGYAVGRARYARYAAGYEDTYESAIRCEAAAKCAECAEHAAKWAKDANANAQFKEITKYYATESVEYSANSAKCAANAAGGAHGATNIPQDHYLLMSAEIALGILKELNSPGCALLG